MTPISAAFSTSKFQCASIPYCHSPFDLQPLSSSDTYRSSDVDCQASDVPLALTGLLKGPMANLPLVYTRRLVVAPANFCPISAVVSSSTKHFAGGRLEAKPYSSPRMWHRHAQTKSLSTRFETL